MTDSLKNHIVEEMKTAMRAKDSERLVTIRMLLAAIKQREVDERITLTDIDTISIINKMIKQRLDAIAQFQIANRIDLVTKEQKEIDILTSYLPQQLSESEIDLAIQTAIENIRPASMQDMGKVMSILKVQLAGRADIAKISAKIKKLLT